VHVPESLTVPHWRPVLRHAVPNVLEGKLIPAALFVGLLQVAGTRTAILGALAFALAAMVVRVVRRKTIPGLLWLTTLGLVARTIAALATGSVVVYFIQPTVATAMVGCAFAGSVCLGRPLVERLFLDFCPLDATTRKHPHLQRFFRHVSLWWAFTSMVNFSITLWLLLSQSATTFVVVKSFLGPVTTTVTLGVAAIWFRSMMARTGTTVVFADRHAPMAPASSWT
jgi:hypothetical protein